MKGIKDTAHIEKYNMLILFINKLYLNLFKYKKLETSKKDIIAKNMLRAS